MTVIIRRVRLWLYSKCVWICMSVMSYCHRKIIYLWKKVAFEHLKRGLCKSLKLAYCWNYSSLCNIHVSSMILPFSVRRCVTSSITESLNLKSNSNCSSQPVRPTFIVWCKEHAAKKREWSVLFYLKIGLTQTSPSSAPCIKESLC